MDTGRFRVHMHLDILPPEYVAARRQDIAATAATSISALGFWFNDLEEARRLARKCNEFVSRLAAEVRRCRSAPEKKRPPGLVLI